jgi:hypothetical protein
MAENIDADSPKYEDYIRGEKHNSRLSIKTFFAIMGIVLGFLSLIATVYYATSYEKKPSLKYDILSDANVLELREEIGKLSILYDSENISEKNLNLRMLTFRIDNDGKIDILEQFYASGEPWGFVVQNGKIIGVNILDSNSSYLKLNLSPEVHLPDTVQFRKIIFEQDKYITLKVLVLHPKDEIPKLAPIGKIAGIEKIFVVDSEISSDKNNYWSKIYKGSFFVQIGRGLFYGIILIVISIIGLLIYVQIRSKIENQNKKNAMKERRKIVQAFKDIYPGDSILDDIILNLFTENKHDIHSLFVILKDGSILQNYVDKIKTGSLVYPESSSKAIQAIEKLLKLGVIEKVEGNVKISSGLTNRISEFINFINDWELKKF